MLRRLRGLWRHIGWLGVASALWRNRVDVRRWMRFARRSIDSTRRRDMPDVMTEARVRAAITADPVLRHDRMVEDVTVEYGNVTVVTRDAVRPETRDRLLGLRRVKGVTDVTAQTVTPERATLTAIS